MNRHEFAIIHESAKIHESATIGPFASIGQNVTVGPDCIIEAHAVIHKNTILGAGNFISSYVSLGGASQSKHDNCDDESFLIIGANNSFHEFCSINRGSLLSSGKTIIGDNNKFMAYVHIGHDCIIGNHTVFVNQATLAGHVQVMDYATIGYSAAVRQFCKVGQGAFINGGSLVVKDIMPYVMVQANPTRVVGINKVGLGRLNFDSDQISEIQECYRKVFRRKLTLDQAIAEIMATKSDNHGVENILNLLKSSERGLVR